MGLGNMFTEKCNLSNMIDNDEPLKVSKVIQKAFIEVNEEGAEAAAATGKFCLCWIEWVISRKQFFIMEIGDWSNFAFNIFEFGSSSSNDLFLYSFCSSLLYVC